MAKFVEWSDISVNFKKLPNGEIEVVEGEDCINQSIKNILTIRRGEKVRSDIGSSLYNVLFEPMSKDSAEELESIIETNISRWENRIILRDVTVLPDIQNQFYEINISYSIRKTREKKNLITFVPAFGGF